MIRRLSWAMTGLVAAFLVAPVLIVIPTAFSSSEYLTFPPPGLSLRWFERFFSSPDWLDAAAVSLQVATAATVLATVLGTLTAVGLTRRRLRASGLVTTVLTLPLVVPLVAYALGLYAVYVQLGLVGSLTGLVLAHAVLALPYVVLNVAAPLRAIDPSAERAAQSLGASPLRAWATVVLPQVGPGVFAGALFAFLTSFDEVVVAIFVTGEDTKTLPVKMWESVRTDLDPTIAAVATMLIVATSAVLAVTGVIASRRGRQHV